MPLTITPRTVANPEIPYSATLISLAISPIVQGDHIEAAMSMRCVPYRVIDGVVESREDLAVTINSGAVFAEAETNPALAKALPRIWDALQDFLTESGI
jgi:hypothetical protein